jgi:hypothetical protein
MTEAVQKVSPWRISIAFRNVWSRSIFRRDIPPANVWETIGWWEARRVPYNLIVCCAGILTCITLAIFLAGSILLFHQDDVGSPLVGLIGIFVYAIMANVCFTFGWVTELLVRKAWPRQTDQFATQCFSLGVGVSVLLTLTPGILAIVVGIFALANRLLRLLRG